MRDAVVTTWEASGQKPTPPVIHLDISSCISPGWCAASDRFDAYDGEDCSAAPGSLARSSVPVTSGTMRCRSPSCASCRVSARVSAAASLTPASLHARYPIRSAGNPRIVPMYCSLGNGEKKETDHRNVEQSFGTERTDYPVTAVVAWERRVGSVSELVVASDSRLSGGEHWDACAKIFDVGRSDAFIAFAGNTWRALPLVFQAVATGGSFQGSQLRTLDLPKFAGHLNAVINEVLSKAIGPAAVEPPDCEFLLGGWSWSLGRFRIYRYFYDQNISAFRYYPITTAPQVIGGSKATSMLGVIGDAGSKVIAYLARERNMGDQLSEPLDYQPLEALHQLTLDEKFPSVGGTVQVAKVYQSIRVEHFAVTVGQGTYVSGRRCLDYENLSLRVINRQPNGVWGVTPVQTSKERQTETEQDNPLGTNALSLERSDQDDIADEMLEVQVLPSNLD